METIHNSLATFYLDALAQSPGQYLGTSGRKEPPIKRIHLSVAKNYHALLLQKMDATKWFQFSVHLQLVIWMVFSVNFSIPQLVLPVFNILCLINGWILFCSINKIWNAPWFALVKGQGKATPTEGFKNLLDLGRNRISRFALLICLLSTLVAGASIHAILLIPVGLLCRWLIESQLKIIIEKSSHAASLKRFVGKKQFKC